MLILTQIKNKMILSNFRIVMQRHVKYSASSRVLAVGIFLFTQSLVTIVHAESWQINLQDADVKAFVNEVSDITGKNFVLDPRINGRVTVVSHKALNQKEIYQLFLSVLDVNGIIALPDGNTITLVPDNVAKQKGLKVDNNRNAPSSELVTRVVYLKNTNVAEILAVLRPLMPQYANIAAVTGVNALVISDRASSLDKLEEIIQTLDGKKSDELSFITLQYMQPEAMLELISSISGYSKNSSVSNSQRLKLLADTAGNRIIIKGSIKTRKYITDLIKKLDVKPPTRLSGMRVFRLKYASASHISKMLTALLGNQSVSATDNSNSLQATSALSGNKAPTLPKKQNTNTATSNNSYSNKKNQQKPFSIIADDTQNALVVNAPVEMIPDIELAIKELDTRRAQVLIQAAIIEVSGDNIDQLGIEWLAGGPDTGYGISSLGDTGVPITELVASIASKNPSLVSSAASKISGALLGIGGTSKTSNGKTQFYGAILQAIKTTTNANLLSMPSILTLDNQQANILVGQNVPFITGSTTTSTSGGSNPYQTIERKDVGINLSVVPHVGANGTIRLEVSQEVSAVVPTANNIKSSDIITNRRLIQTTVLAEDKQTIALGGLMSEDSSESTSKVPFFGDLPWIGKLFQSSKTAGTKRNLIVFLRPTVLYDGKELSDLSKKRYQQLRVLQLELDNSGNLTQNPLKW